MTPEQRKALEDLDCFLSTQHPIVTDLATCTPGPLKGITVHTGVLSPTVIEEVIKHLAIAITKMIPTAEYNGVPLSETVLGDGILDLNVFNPYRCFKNNFGNLDFAYMFLRQPKKEDYAKVVIDETQVLFDINTVYSHVTLPMLLHPDSEKLRDTIWLLGGECPLPRMLSWDSAKIANRPRRKPKTMTDQRLTRPHMDIYDDSLGRIQSIINLDYEQQDSSVVSYQKPGLIETGTKLFFVPGAGHPIAQQLIKIITGNQRLYNKRGYVGFNASQHPELINIFVKHAFAPAYNSMVSWRSCDVHFEGKTGKLITKGPRKGLYSCKGLTHTQDSVRLRIPVGTQSTGKVTESGMKKLGLIALSGFIPAVYFNPNRDNEVGKITVALKTTQKMQTRELSSYDRDRFTDLEREAETWTDDTFDQFVTNPALRQLLGVWDQSHH